MSTDPTPSGRTQPGPDTLSEDQVDGKWEAGEMAACQFKVQSVKAVGEKYTNERLLKCLLKIITIEFRIYECFRIERENPP